MATALLTQAQIELLINQAVEAATNNLQGQINQQAT
jgi:hypothetical protein